MDSLASTLQRFFRTKSKEQQPQIAYDQWSGNYDDQPDNLMLAWDNAIFSELINVIDPGGKTIVDVGCGTGRHWQELYNKNVRSLIGFDVSEGMLSVLQAKFPQAVTHRLNDNILDAIPAESCDCVVSTLTIAHIKNAEEAITEWCRILKPGGHLIITDYHPYALTKGATRTFNYKSKTFSIRNYVHTLESIDVVMRQLKMQQLRLIEKIIDASAKPFYEKQNALPIYEAWKGVPVIYGKLLKKSDEPL